MISLSKLVCGASQWSDGLRYGNEPDASAPPDPAEVRPVVVFNTTRRCNLKCKHCYAAATCGPVSGELSTDEALGVLDDLAAFGCPVVLFFGGEPLLRPDLPELISGAAEAGLRTVVSTNGTLMTEELAGKLGEVGLHYAGISLDGLEAAHDAFRGRKGAFAAALTGMRRAMQAGVKVGLRMTLNKHNVGDIDGIFDLIAREGIPRVCFYHLVYSGRGSDMRGDDLSRRQTRATMDLLIDRTAALHRIGRDVEVLTVDNHADGPYVYMHLQRTDPPAAEECMTLLKRNGGNRSGIAIGCVTATGDVLADQFWRDRAVGNVRERPFSEIWSDPAQPLLAKLRDRRKYLGPRCLNCRWLDVCNGNFRARAEAATGDPWGDDPACYLTDEEIAII